MKVEINLIVLYCTAKFIIYTEISDMENIDDYAPQVHWRRDSYEDFSHDIFDNNYTGLFALVQSQDVDV